MIYIILNTWDTNVHGAIFEWTDPVSNVGKCIHFISLKSTLIFISLFEVLKKKLTPREILIIQFHFGLISGSKRCMEN